MRQYNVSLIIELGSMRVLVAPLIASTVFFGCTSQIPDISQQIAAQVRANKTAAIEIGTVGPQRWERFCVLPPYTTNETAEQILGFKWDAGAKTSIASSDLINVLVFIHENKVAAYVEHPRGKGDFSEMNPRCVPREKATLIRRSGSDGWVFLVVKNTP